MTARPVTEVVGHSRIDGVVPGVRGQRALRFETLTMLFEGRVEHVDSLGNEVALVSGST